MSSNDTDPAKFAWYNWADRVYRERSAEAYHNATTAFSTLEKMISSGKLDHYLRGTELLCIEIEPSTLGNVSTLQHELGLCSAVEPNSTATLALPNLYSSIWYGAAQSDYNVASASRFPIANPLDAFVNASVAASRPLQVLNDTFWAAYGAPGPSHQSCFNISASASALLAPGLQAVPFSYLGCECSGVY